MTPATPAPDAPIQLVYVDNQPKPQTRAGINRANSTHSTGPRTAAGKWHSAQNAITHGLTARIPVLPTEDFNEYKRHLQLFRDEYKPATPTEQQLTQELADTAWRQNRIPSLEAQLLTRAAAEYDPNFDIVDAHRARATLGLHSQRLSRQFQKTLDRLVLLQDTRRRQHESDLARAAALLDLHRSKEIPFDPAEYGFVFSIDEIRAARLRLVRQHEASVIQYAPQSQHDRGRTRINLSVTRLWL